MRKFPTSIYSGKPRRRARPVYHRRSLLDDVRNARSQKDFDVALNDVFAKGIAYGTGIGPTSINPEYVFKSG